MSHFNDLFILTFLLLYLLDLALNDMIFILLHITIKFFRFLCNLCRRKLLIYWIEKVIRDRFLEVIPHFTFHSFVIVDRRLLLSLYRSKQVGSSCYIFGLFVPHAFIVVIKLVIKEIFIVLEKMLALKLHFIIVWGYLLFFDIFEGVASLLCFGRYFCLQGSFKILFLCPESLNLCILEVLLGY